MFVLAACALALGGFGNSGRPSHAAGERDRGNELLAADNWFFHQRAYPNRTTPPGALDRAMRQTIGLRRSATDRAATNITWTRLGPNPIASYGPSVGTEYSAGPPLAGRVSAIAPAPSNSNVVYLGAANGGVWKSVNGGSSWASVWPNNTASFSIGSIAVNPSNASDVWVGTGEANNSGDAYYGNGLYHSPDGGVTWTRVDTGHQFEGCFIAGLDFVSPSVVNAAVLEYPGIQDPACNYATKRRVWHITNANTLSPTLTPVWLPGSTEQAPSDFSPVPGSPNTIFLATYYDGIYKSTNGGQSWTKLTAAPAGSVRGVVNAFNANIVYFAYSYFDSANNDLLRGVWKSTNGGVNWSPVVSQGSATNANTPCTYPTLDPKGGNGQCSYDFTLAVDPLDSTRFFIGGIRVFRYTNSGASKGPIGFGGAPGTIHVDQHVTVFDSAHNMWEGSDGGAYRLPASQLGVASPAFSNMNGSGGTALGITEFNGWASGSVQGGTFIGGTQDNGTVKYTTLGGLNWRMDHGGDGGASAFVSPLTYFATYYGPDIDRTTDGGANYSTVFHSNNSSEFYPPLEQDPGNLTTLYRGTDRIWRTTTATAATPTWAVISPRFSGDVSAIGVPKTASPAYLYAGIDGSSATPKLEYTHNATAVTPTWSAGTGVPDRYVTDIWVNPSNQTKAILTVSGFGTAHVFRTTTGGASWVSMNGNLPDVPVNAVAVDPANAAKVFLGTDTGVFWTTNGGAASPTWVNTSAGLPNTTVMDLLVDGSKLVAATHGRGAWVAAKP